MGVFSVSTALAQDTHHYYGGISAGTSRTDSNPASLTQSLLPGVTTLDTSIDKQDTAYKIFGGYQFNRNLALEAGYFNLGRNSFGASTSPAGSLSGETKVHGLNLDLVGTLPLTQRFSAQARIGAQHAWSRSHFSGTGAAAALGSSKSDDTNMKVGLGMQYEISPAFWIRGEVERYRIEDAAGTRNNVTVASMSLIIPFGRVTPTRVVSATNAPAYVAPLVTTAPTPAPTPAPVLAPPVAAITPEPAAPVRQRVTLSADTLFGFDQSRVQPSTALNELRNEVMSTRVESIRVEGHTDRMGSEAYNQQLSVERAEAVKTYLVVVGGQDPMKITTSGKGESQPVTRATDCPDQMPRNQRIACLQPDRRVEVEVTGNR